METWEIILIVAGSIFILWNLVVELSCWSTYGWFISKKDAENYNDLKKSEYWLNPYNNRILSLHNHREHIALLPLPSLYGKYCISKVGVVPRWSKLHSKIEEYYRKARNKQ